MTPTPGIEPGRPERPRVPVLCNTIMRYGHSLFIIENNNPFKTLSPRGLNDKKHKRNS